MEEVRIPRAILEGLQEQLSMLQKTLERLTEQNRQKDERIEELTQMLLNMQPARFGQRSEKSVYVLDDGTRQLSIFDPPQGESAETAAENTDTQAAEPLLTEVAAGEGPGEDTGEVMVSGNKRRKKRTLEELCANLPVEEHVVDIPESEQVSETGSPLVCIGREYIRTELVMERAKLKVVKHYRKVYANREWEMEYGDADLYKPDMPAPLLKHSYVSPSVATDVMVKKYAGGLPLFRQEQQWTRLGVPLKRGTMANWMIQLSQRYFARFRDRLREELVKQAVIHADETVLQVLKEEGKDPTTESRMWVYASSKRADKQIRLFDYRDSRKSECAKEFLEGFHGILVTDGYSGYNKVPEVTRAGCWAHMRRKWHEAMPKGDGEFIRIRTFDRAHGGSRSFIVRREVLWKLPEGETAIDSDLDGFLEAFERNEMVQMRIYWLSVNNDVISGYKQSFEVPLTLILRALHSRDMMAKYLYRAAKKPTRFRAIRAAHTLRKIQQDNQVRRAFSKGMRDHFRWPGDTVTLYSDGPNDLYFTTESGFPANGGLILHEGSVNTETIPNLV